MNDRELLEKAAKAAGLKIDKSPDNGGGSGNTGFNVLGDAMLDWHNDIAWNPLRDDGDALRLAVKLRMKVEVGSNAITVNGFMHGDLDMSDPCAATRLAIVRTAAATAPA